MFITDLTRPDLTLPMSDKPVLPDADETKKELIIRLLERGTPPQEIARIVGTSVGYVYKETALFRKGDSKMVLTKSRKTSVTLGPPLPKGSSAAGADKISRADKVKVEVEHDALVSAPPLDSEAVKVIFDAFAKGQKPAEILAKHGFNPEAVEIEYRRYLRLTEQDHAALLKDIIDRFITYKSDTVDTIVASYRKNGLLANTQLTTLLSLELAHRFDGGQKDMVLRMADASTPPPEGWERPLCYMCKAPIAEIWFLRNSLVAKWMRDAKLACSLHEI